MSQVASAVLMVLRDKLVDELIDKVHDLENRVKVAESLSIRQARREIATGTLAEGVRISDEEWTVDLVRQDVCLLTDLLDSEIRLGHQGSTATFRIAEKWRNCRWIGWRLTDDLVLIELVHADFSIRFTVLLEPSTDQLFRNAGLQWVSPQILASQTLASRENPMEVRLTTLQIRTVSNCLAL